MTSEFIEQEEALQMIVKSMQDFVKVKKNELSKDSKNDNEKIQ